MRIYFDETRILALAAGAMLATLASASAGELKQIGMIKVTGKPLGTYDIGFVDQKTGRYYLADRTNKALDIIDTRTGQMIAQVPGFVGQEKKNDTSGPDGVLVAGTDAWVGDGDSTVKVVDLKTNKVADTISTGGKNRVDEMAYDPKDHVVLVVNNADDPPFATLISTKAGHKVLAKIPFPDATDGAEQPIYDSATNLFYASIPEIKGDKAKGGVAVIDATGKLVKIMPVDGCHPAGLVHGPGNNLLLGCTAGSKDSGLPPQFVVVTTGGAVAKTIPGLGGADMVAYNPKIKQYYTASRDMPDGPELGVIDAKTNTLIQRIKLKGGNPHSVAVSEANNHVFVPMGEKGADPDCGGCIAIFAPQK